MDSELINLLYEAEEMGIYDEDVTELEMYINGRLLTSVTMENNSTDIPEYVFWTRSDDGVTEEETDLSDEEKITILKEVIAWY